MATSKNIMIKNKSKILVIITATILIVFSVYIHEHGLISTPVRYMDPQYAADFSNDKILMGASHNVFVGKVIQKIGTKERGIGPETQFSVEVIDNIKGNLKGIVTLDQEGGYENGAVYVVDDGTSSLKGSAINSYFLNPGSTYLFATRYSKKENWYTLNPYPTARELLSISVNNINDSQLKTLAEDDPRVQALKMAYPHEILLDADIKNSNTLNSYKSIQEKSIAGDKNNS
jgi:hypothetical protein